jgi:tetratricopeptide (TPR) repeat protein
MVTRRTIVSIVIFTLVAVVRVVGQAPPPSPQQLFEAGQYDPAIQAITSARAQGGGGLAEAFLAAHVFLKQSLNDRAKEEFAKLAASEDQIWRQVGESSIAAVDGDFDRATDLATQAVNAANERAAQAAATGAPPDPAAQNRDFHAFYQLGLAKSRRDDWQGAFDAFDRAATLNPGFAYAHFYAGMSASRIQRLDRVAGSLEQFLQLAPNAPERPAVMSVLQTLRGT